MSKENMLFAGTLLLVVIALASFCLYFGRPDASDLPPTSVNKNEYLISAPSLEPAANLPATRPAVSTAPLQKLAVESATPPSARASGSHGGSGGGRSGGHGH